jgi:hypothetical protein
VNDSMKTRCACAHCRMRSLMGPIMIITIGVLFLLREFTRFGIGELWPILLIVPGIVLVAQSMASKSGHIGG